MTTPITGSGSPAFGRELARTLTDTLTSALVAGASEGSWSLARDAAQLLGLDGLDRALATCAPHAGHAFPADLAILADRIERLAAECRESGDVAVFRAHDLELRALAEEVGGFEWSEPEAGSADAAVATLGVGEVLVEIAAADEESHAVARRSRLTIPVAAALRAALDWLTPEHAPASVRLLGEPSSLEVRFDRVRHDRLTASHRVIAAVGGNLGPALEADGTPWIIRVPGYASRVTYLTLVRGGVPLALPWHAVLKIRMVASDRTLEHPLLDGLPPLEGAAEEHPVVLVGHGLKRGYVAVDRIVWRMMGDPCVAPLEPPPGLRDAVRSDEGEAWWVVDPARLLDAVDVPVFEAPAPAAPDTKEPATEIAEAEPAADSEPEAAPEPRSLTPDDVVALHARVPMPIAMMGMPKSTSESGADPLPAPAGMPLALLAEDSITSRLFLSRLLEQQGFAVAAVSTRAQLLRRLTERAWALVLTDVELPDAPRGEGLPDTVDAASAQPRPAAVVALVRDRMDIDMARAAGIEHTLLKPVARETLAALVARLGIAGRPA